MAEMASVPSGLKMSVTSASSRKPIAFNLAVPVWLARVGTMTAVFHSNLSRASAKSRPWPSGSGRRFLARFVSSQTIAVIQLL